MEVRPQKTSLRKIFIGPSKILKFFVCFRGFTGKKLFASILVCCNIFRS